MALTSRVLVLSSNEYSITENGKTNAGVSIEYCELGAPMNTPEKKGFSVLKQSLPLEQRAALRAVPGVYDMEFNVTTATNKQGKTIPTLKPSQVLFVGGVSLSPLPLSQPNAAASR